MTDNARDLALITILAVAPVALIVLVALLRGYTIHLHMYRRKKGDD